MKTITTLFLLFFGLTAMAQTTAALPAKEFALQLSEDNVNIKPGESHPITVSIFRSRAFAKGSVKLGTSSVLPQGITLQFEPSEGHIDTSVVTVSIDAMVIPKSYQIIIKGDVYNKIKGTTLKLVVSNEVLVVK